MEKGNECMNITELVERARAAMQDIQSFDQLRVDSLAAGIVYTVSRPEMAGRIAKMAIEEGGLGDEKSKYNKLADKIPACLYDVLPVKTVGVVERDIEKGLTKIAKPVGVIAGLIPSTNPAATPVFKGILSLRGRNAIVFAPHPRTKSTTNFVVNLMREFLVKNNVNPDIMICIDEPGKEATFELMKQCDLVMATGSGDMVRAAYSSGKPAYGVGAGNASAVIDEDADLEETAKKILIGKVGDNASGCSCENSVVIHKAVYDRMMIELQKVGGYLLNSEQKSKLQNTLWVDGHLNSRMVAQPIRKIADLTEISVPDAARFLMVSEEGIGRDYPFSGEKMSLVLTVYKCNDIDDAISIVNRLTGYSGLGHSCAIHSNNEENILKYALNTKTTKVNVRQPNGVANSGSWENGLAKTFSLGCGTWGGNIVSENVTQKHYINTTWVNEPIKINIPTEDEIYGDMLKNIVL